MSELDLRSADLVTDARPAAHVGTPERRRHLQGYIRAHWRGELPLGQSFWVNTIALSVMLLLFEAGVLALMIWRPPAWAFVILFLLMYGAFRLLVATWQIVGTLRAAALLENRWSGLVNVVMVIIILAVLGQTVAFGWEIEALSDDALSQLLTYGYTVSVSDDGQAIVAKGPLGLGYAGAVESAFAEHPQITRLEMDSRSGDVPAAVKLGDFLARRPDIAVEIDKHCAGACLVAFTAASQRIIGAKAELIFAPLQRIADLGVANHAIERAQQRLSQRLMQLGASTFFMHDAFATPGVPYQPDATTLFSNGVITGIDLESGVMNADAWRIEQFLYPLRENPKMRSAAKAIELIRVRYPKIFDDWLKSNLAARYESNLDVREQKFERAFLHALSAAGHESLINASDAGIEHMAVAHHEDLILIGQVASPGDCGKYLGGEPVDFGASQFGIFLRGVNRMTALIGESNPGHPAPFDPVAGAARLEQVRKEVATVVPRQRGANPYDTACERETTLLERLTEKHTSGDAMALRFMFLGTADREGREAFLFSP